MTFDPGVPNAGQSPGLFPPQNQTNFTRLKTIINSDHVFNDTGQPTDGTHRQMSMIDRADPVGVPFGTNSIIFTKTISGFSQICFFNGAGVSQITPVDQVISGTVNVNGLPFVTLAAVPANKVGFVYLYRGRFVQAGAWVSDATVVNGYSYSEKFQTGSSASAILQLGFDGDGASGLNLRVQNPGSSSFNGIWTFKIFHRDK